MKICFDPVISGKELLGAMRIAIIDDFAPERADIRSAIEKYCGERDFDCEFSEFDSAEALFDAFTPGLFGAGFLDIYMRGVAGTGLSPNAPPRSSPAAPPIRSRGTACTPSATSYSR